MTAMSQRNVNLYLQVPTKPISLLERLEVSQLESLIEHKPIDYTGIDLRRVRIFDIQSSSQIKGTVEVIGSELLIRFPARNVGVHTARIFANTKEVCRPVAFIVKATGQVESIDVPMYTDYTDSGLASGTSTVREVESQPVIPLYLPSPPQSPTGVVPLSPTAAMLYHYPVNKPPSRPRSGNFDNTGTTEYAGDLFGRPTGASFEQLLTAKLTKQVVPGIPHSSSRLTSTTEFMTPDALMRISREAKQSVGVAFGKPTKKKCKICTRKTKTNKCVTFWEMDYCNGCYKRNFMCRGAIEHFMAPSIQECSVQVPMNKRGTKLTTERMIVPNVNLRGLEPNDVRDAMVEFHKFDVEGDGWMDKVVLLPVLKACFTYSIPHRELKILLSSTSLGSMIEKMGLDKRDKVHHIEYLALLAFISRERQRLMRDMIPNSKFTHNDLEMAYAFQNQFSTAPHANTHPHKQPPVNKPRLLNTKVVTIPKSYTDSPLSHYQPTSLVQKQSNELYPVISPSPSLPQHITHDDEMEEEPIDNDAPPTSPISPTEGDPSQDKKPKKPSMEQLKLTGDQRADGWMMY